MYIRLNKGYVVTGVVICLVLLFSCLLSTSHAEDNRWVWIFSNERLSRYVDKNTMEYSNRGNTIKFWMRTVRINSAPETYELTKYEVNLEDKTQRTLTEAFVKNGFTTNQQDLHWSTCYIVPDSFLEKAANYVAHIESRPNVYPVSVERWNWVYSTDTATFSLSPDSVVIDRNAQTAATWMKCVSQYMTEERRIICHFDNNTLGYKEAIDSPERYNKEILPGSKEEVMYNYLYQKYKDSYNKN